MQYTIEGVGLEKTFVKKRSVRELLTHPFRRAERIAALRGVDLTVREGEIVGLLGPNGAGKTTLLKIFSCLILPNRGRAAIAGIDTGQENRVKRCIGLVHSDERSFYWRLTARENLRFFARLYEVPSRQIDARIEELLRRVEMTDAADRRFSEYSSGMKQRISIARALLHDPPILLMDEPTRSLDPAAALELRAFILERLKRQAGKTILLATHNLKEAEAVSDRIAILIQGRLRRLGTVAEIRQVALEERRFRLEVVAAEGPLSGPFRTVTDETVDGKRWVTVAPEPAAELDDVLRALLGAGVSIRACDRVEPDLEEAFSKILKAESES